MVQKIQNISIADLELDTKNFRFPEKKSQRESLYTIIDSRSARTRAVIQSIADEGYFLDEHLFVVPQTGKSKYTVIEGNRRLASLMALHEPDRVEKSKQHNFIKRLSAQCKGDLPIEVPCVVFSTLKSCFKRIQLRHGLDNKGAGKVDWEAIQKDRFDREANPKEPKPLLELVEHIYNQKWMPESSLELLEEDGLVPNYTTLQRIFDSKPARELLNVTKEDYLSTSLAKADYEKVLSILFHVIVLGEKFDGIVYDSRSLNSSGQIKNFLESVIESATTKKKLSSKIEEEGAVSDTSAGKVKDKQQEPKDDSHNADGKSKKGSKFKTSTNLIPAHFEADVIKSLKAGKLFNELKELNAKKFNNVAAVMIRVAVEITIECYLERNQYNVPSKKHKDGKKAEAEAYFQEKINYVVDKIKSHGVKYHKQAKSLGRIVSDSKNPIHYQALHLYVHDQHVSAPSHDELIKAWGSINDVIQNLWKGVWDEQKPAKK